MAKSTKGSKGTKGMMGSGKNMMGTSKGMMGMGKDMSQKACKTHADGMMGTGKAKTPAKGKKSPTKSLQGLRGVIDPMMKF
jgi:hypothetical protein